MPPGNHSQALLSVADLSLERGGRQLFSELSFEVTAGQLIQLGGANGAGKTSLLRILCGLSRYGYEGQIQRRAGQFFLGHQAGVKGLLSPRENIAWHVDGQGSHSDDQISEALSQVGLFGYEDLPSNNLSAGQQRRVNLARLYLTGCPLWLLDEPFTAIDRDGVAGLEALMVGHVERGGAVILTSHQTLSVSYPVQFLDLQNGFTS
jgi:heme exporter protein A